MYEFIYTKKDDSEEKFELPTWEDVERERQFAMQEYRKSDSNLRGYRCREIHFGDTRTTVFRVGYAR